MVDYARSLGALPFLLVQTGLVHLPPGQDPEQAYDGISFPEASGHDVFDELVAQVHEQAKNDGVFNRNVHRQQSILNYHWQNQKNAKMEWQKWTRRT